MTKNNNCLLHNKRDLNKTNKFLKFLNIFCFSLIFASISFYLFNISQLATQGFVLRELKFAVNVLASEKSDLEEKLSFAQSYYSFNSRVAQLNMIEVSEIEYLKTGTSLAKK